MQRDSIDFGKTNVSQLFAKMFFPTLMGLLFGSLLNIADGIFVGRGVGSDALAAINVAAPVFLITTGVSLMFASGVSIVASIHLSHQNFKAANINITQALTVPLVLMAVVLTILDFFPRQVTFLFGGSERLVPLVTDYLIWVSPSMLMCVIMFVGMFVIRLDGSPNFAMAVNIFEAVLNIVLDYVFVFPLGMGIKGAAIATSIASILSAILILVYLFFYTKTIHFYMPKFSAKALRLTARNVGYMCKMGFSTFLGETAICCTMIVGNFMFMHYLHEDGVAAFSVACYLFPLVFMAGNAVAQSSQPIISYNHGLGSTERVKRTLRIAIVVSSLLGVLITVLGIIGSHALISMFLEPGISAWKIAVNGFPLYSTCFLFFTLNIVMIGYYQSIEKASHATVFMFLRGYLLVIPCFLFLPQVMGNKGLWLAIPVAETLTFIAIIITMLLPVNRNPR